jgi:quinol monooxygenase YgiN
MLPEIALTCLNFVISSNQKICVNLSFCSLDKEDIMVKTALLVRLEAKPGKEAEVEDFLRGGLAIVREEPATVAWFALRLGPSTFGIFDAFPDEDGRQAHLSGRVAAALLAKASELLAVPPVIEKVEVLAAKLPGQDPTP